MKYLNKLVLSAALAMASISGALRADTFSFSYVIGDTYGAPGEFHGTLSGTQVGDTLTGYVTGVTVNTLYINDNEVSGPFLNTSFDIFTDWNAYGSAVVSFDRDQNNFLFINGDFQNSDPFSGYAYLLNGSGSFGSWAYLDTPPVTAVDGGDGVWTLTVPDNGATVGLLGLALVGFAAVRRKLAAR